MKQQTSLKLSGFCEVTPTVLWNSLVCRVLKSFGCGVLWRIKWFCTKTQSLPFTSDGFLLNFPLVNWCRSLASNGYLNSWISNNFSRNPEKGSCVTKKNYTKLGFFRSLITFVWGIQSKRTSASKSLRTAVNARVCVGAGGYSWKYHMGTQFCPVL